MKPQEFKELLDRYARGECIPQEEKFIDAWYERIGDQDKEEVEIVLADHNNEKKREHRMWAAINPEKHHHKKSFFRSFGRVAAAILFVAVSALGVYFLSGEATLQEK